jgi:hypothetical protein
VVAEPSTFERSNRNDANEMQTLASITVELDKSVLKWIPDHLDHAASVPRAFLVKAFWFTLCIMKSLQ